MTIKNIKLIKSDKQFKSSPLNSSARSMPLSELLELKILKSPDCDKILKHKKGNNSHDLTDGENTYFVENGCPILYPKVITDSWDANKSLPFKEYDNPLLKYILLSQIKQSGEINAPFDSLPARKHQWRYKDFCSNLTGVVLDVGSDCPSHSMQFLPEGCHYIGLDPYSGHGEFRLIGLGEVLPISDRAVDAVTFNTSLDHILDYHTAIHEAYRVLKPGGIIKIASYAWLESATLLTDAVHFHHFRESQLLSGLEDCFEIEEIKRYEDPKNATHRYGIYISAIKR